MAESHEPHVLSVNVGGPTANPYKEVEQTGIDKRPQVGRVTVGVPEDGGSGLAGDFVGDVTNHGGVDQAVYVFAREDLNVWEQYFDRQLPNGSFGENLTTVGIDVNEALIGERWQIGPPDAGIELQITAPRIPCRTFRGWVDEPQWLKTFTAAARPGAYLRVISAGTVGAGDAITITHRPTHAVTVSIAFRAVTTERHLLPRVVDALDDFSERMRTKVVARQGFDHVTVGSATPTPAGHDHSSGDR